MSKLAGYLVYCVVIYLGRAPKHTMTLRYRIGATIGYDGNWRLTFAHKGGLLCSGVRYFGLHCLGYFIYLSTFIVLVDEFSYPPQCLKSIVIFVATGLFLIAFKFFVFTNSSASTLGKL